MQYTRLSSLLPLRHVPLTVLFALLLQLAAADVARSAWPDSTAAVADSSVDIPDTIWTDVKEFASEGLLLFAAPARWRAVGWGTAGGVVAGTGLLTLADDEMRDWSLARWHSPAGDRAADAGNLLGTPLPALGISGSLYLGGLIFDEPGVRRAGRHVAQAVAYSGLITTALKATLGRQRPYVGEGPYVFHGPSVNDRYHSLPSGHSTLAFALCSSLAADIDHPVATVVLYGIATATAASRIYSDRHWLSDTFLGAAIGTACGWGVVNLGDDGDGDASGDGGVGRSFLLVPGPGSLTAVWVF